MNLPPGTTESHIARGWEIGAGDEPVSEPYDPRRVMRGWAMSYRAWIHPEAFDGTAETYNANLATAAACLMEARAWNRSMAVISLIEAMAKQTARP